MTTPPIKPWARLSLVLLMLSATAACNTLTRLSEVGDGPQVSPIQNPTSRGRDDSESTGVTSLMGWEGKLANALGQNGDPASLIDFGTNHNTEGSGTINRSEELQMSFAAVVSQILPNGNLVIHGRQEVRVNYELRDLRITGVIRPEDIDPANAVAHTKIAEMRVFYGGRGTVSDLQQPRWGTQVWDTLFPF